MTRIILVSWILATMIMLASCGQHVKDQKAPHSPPKSQALAPSSDCISIVYELEDCITYLALYPGADPKPTNTCCSVFEKVAKTDAYCICLAIKGSEDYGIPLNMTRVKGLSGVCKFPDGFKIIMSCLASISSGASPPELPPSKKLPKLLPPEKSSELPPPKKSPKLLPPEKSLELSPPLKSPKLPPPKESPEPSSPSKSPPEEAPSAAHASPPQNVGSPPAKNGGGTIIMTKAPAPVKGGAHTTSTSLMVLISLFIASFSLVLV